MARHIMTMAVLAALFLALSSTAATITGGEGMGNPGYSSRALLQDSPNICTIPGGTIIDATPLNPALPSPCKWCYWGFKLTEPYPNKGCIALDGYWRPTCPAPGVTPSINHVADICIARGCANSSVPMAPPPISNAVPPTSQTTPPSTTPPALVSALPPTMVAAVTAPKLSPPLTAKTTPPAIMTPPPAMVPTKPRVVVTPPVTADQPKAAKMAASPPPAPAMGRRLLQDSWLRNLLQGPPSSPPPSPGPPPLPQCCPTYTIVKGDSLHSIGLANEVSSLTITTFNRQVDNATLIPGQHIELPCPRALLFFNKMQTLPITTPAARKQLG